jgi:hypothetical protein
MVRRGSSERDGRNQTEFYQVQVGQGKRDLQPDPTRAFDPAAYTEHRVNLIETHDRTGNLLQNPHIAVHCTFTCQLYR